MDLQIKGLNIQNALLTIDIQDYLQALNVITLYLIVIYHGKTDFKTFLFVDRNVILFFCVFLYNRSFSNVQ